MSSCGFPTWGGRKPSGAGCWASSATSGTRSGPPAAAGVWGRRISSSSGHRISYRGRHERRGAGLNHLAFHLASRAELDALVARSPLHGWALMFPERHPYAGGEEHYAAYLENRDGFEVELVAGPDQS